MAYMLNIYINVYWDNWANRSYVVQHFSTRLFIELILLLLIERKEIKVSEKLVSLRISVSVCV